MALYKIALKDFSIKKKKLKRRRSFPKTTTNRNVTKLCCNIKNTVSIVIFSMLHFLHTILHFLRIMRTFQNNP